eukprot:TRINITY_DN9207_c0_g1_i1.p1 TRINITY_DN9207_c0_g1~~TRINITY_DN9207_c0_g1_i1.p1  ORF type:complete len:360 (+),score=59.36 TRINITY_DN9207_c0_g1_i1:1002-2081(+)
MLASFLVCLRQLRLNLLCVPPGHGPPGLAGTPSGCLQNPRDADALCGCHRSAAARSAVLRRVLLSVAVWSGHPPRWAGAMAAHYCARCDEGCPKDSQRCYACTGTLCALCTPEAAEGDASQQLQTQVEDLRAALAQATRERDRERAYREEAARLADERVAVLKRKAERDKRVIQAYLDEVNRYKGMMSKGDSANLHKYPAHDDHRSSIGTRPGDDLRRSGGYSADAAALQLPVIDAADAEVVRRREAFDRGEHHQPNCALCFTAYTMRKREHHCRSCYLSVCSDCSGVRASSQRACDVCVVGRTLSSDYFTHVLPSGQFSTWIRKLHAVAHQLAERQQQLKYIRTDHAQGIDKPKGHAS